jgi:hypothetical protein
MPSPLVHTVSRVEAQRSLQLINDSRVLMALAQALIAQSRQSMARQSYVRIVCAWCQQMLRWHRAEEMIRGQISHSICFDCFAHVFWELDPDNTPPPICTQATAGDHSSHGLQLREDARRAGATDPMAGVASHRGGLGYPADVPLTPRTFNEVITLP